VDLFKSAMTDETLMPPRCCRIEIPLRFVEGILGYELVVEFKEKLREFGTKNRLYCPQETCSAFIGEASNTKGEEMNCPKCWTLVCAYCKSASHPGWEPCSDDKDPASKLVLELGDREGWRRCRGCGRLVELDHGWCVLFQLDNFLEVAP
jgi:IBR domain, a half RING-finger domain